MRQARWSTLLALALLLSLGEAEADNPEPPAPGFARLEPGMSQEQVRERVGPPKRIARQLLYHRYREQWIYDTPLPVRLTFECPRGRKPYLVTPLPFSSSGKGRESGAAAP